MRIGDNRQRAITSWLFVCALFALCCVLGVLQYRWITEVSETARYRLRESLQTSLTRASNDFDSAIGAACAALRPSAADSAQTLENELVSRYRRWKSTTRRPTLFQRLAVAVPGQDSVSLLTLDLNMDVLTPSEWPPEWRGIRDRIEANFAARLQPEHGATGHRPGPDGAWGPPAGPGEHQNSDGFAFEEPIFASAGDFGRGRFGQRETGWVVYELNQRTLTDILLPDILRRDLNTTSGLEYQVEVTTKTSPPSVLYQTAHSEDVAEKADAQISLFRPRDNPAFRRGGRDRGPGPPRGPSPDSGRWQMFVRHRAGSLDAVVAQSRMRSLAVTGGVLLLMLATAVALLRYTRSAQKLAHLQMDFVAGVSHELRTPLTVIHTAGYNLQGKLAHNPAQVEKYGALIQRESGRLGELVEQVLQFASANAGRILKEREPLSVESVIDETMEANRAVIDSCHCVVEKTVDPGLPPILGDSKALRQVFENLLCNAAKYGSQGGNWIGIFASKPGGQASSDIEIRVSDRGPGIPLEEQQHIFDPFYRGARAVQDQIHGTGLGLSLVKKIVEAHGGSIQVKSEPMKGAEFIVRLPAAPAGAVG